MDEREILDSPTVASALTARSIVQVHIGQVVVNRPAVPSPPPPPPRRSLLLTLDEYLDQRAPIGSRHGVKR
jgi:hypothetical protein